MEPRSRGVRLSEDRKVSASTTSIATSRRASNLPVTTAPSHSEWPSSGQGHRSFAGLCMTLLNVLPVPDPKLMLVGHPKRYADSRRRLGSCLAGGTAKGEGNTGFFRHSRVIPAVKFGIGTLDGTWQLKSNSRRCRGSVISQTLLIRLILERDDNTTSCDGVTSRLVGSSPACPALR